MKVKELVMAIFLIGYRGAGITEEEIREGLKLLGVTFLVLGGFMAFGFYSVIG
jgi:hypothetical protein